MLLQARFWVFLENDARYAFMNIQANPANASYIVSQYAEIVGKRDWEFFDLEEIKQEHMITKYR